jgi:hypothetical protein
MTIMTLMTMYFALVGTIISTGAPALCVFDSLAGQNM